MSRLFSAEDIKIFLQAEVLEFNNTDITSIVIDSREAQSGSLFIPLVGEFTDGNLYIESALIGGCNCSLVSKKYFLENKDQVLKLAKKYESTFFIVEDGLKALQKLAKEYIGQFKQLKVVAITGSSGKTTTKEVLGSILSNFKNTLVTKGNYNSETGLPLTVFRITKEHEIAVIEMGMSKPGEIKDLVDIINPDISLITNIGSAHIGFFGSRDGIAKEKKDAFANFTGNNLAVIPSWDDYYELLKTGVNADVLSVTDTPRYITGIKDLGFNGWEFLYEDIKINYQYMGRYNLLNAFMAIACAREIGVPSETIAKGLSNLPSIFGRGELLNGQSRIIRDCYNANPESTISSLELLAKTTWDNPKIPILGSMLELGDISYSEHVKVAKFAISKFKVVILYGDQYRDVFKNLKEELGVLFFDNMDDLKIAVKEVIKPNSLVLLKASRGVKLEEITDSIL
ncbi:MAG: UDP-N-acetylmuramoyl-tripeptide--D-alanyl-D-alanine ligase [Spirochaetaceae bacterium]